MPEALSPSFQYKYEYQPGVREPRKLNRRFLGRAFCLLILIGFAAMTGVLLHAHSARNQTPVQSELTVRELSDFPLDQVNGAVADVPIRWRNLDGQRVALVGNLWAPTVDSSGTCIQFQLTCQVDERTPPAAQRFVSCSTVQPMPEWTSTMDVVRATGILRINIVHKNGVIASVFSLDVDRLEPLNDAVAGTEK
jgi:hypothetical protein